jgi:anti-anti-sigma regulatory factor
MSTQTDPPRAYDVTKNSDIMTVVIRKEFDFGNLHQDWAHLLTINHPGPFKEIRIDLTACGLVSSTFFAGLIQIHHVYGGTGTKQVTLVKPDPRMVRNLAMLRLDKLFVIEAR